jgi:hypothetical protein
MSQKEGPSKKKIYIFFAERALRLFLACSFLGKKKYVFIWSPRLFQQLILRPCQSLPDEGIDLRPSSKTRTIILVSSIGS